MGMSNFWNQTWKQFDRIKENRGEEAAKSYLKKITERLDENRKAGI